MLKSLLPPPPRGRDVVIGEWIVSPSRNMVRRRSEKHARSIEPLLVRFLDTLAKHAGETVTKDELIERVWDGVIVSDEAVAQAASRLRKVLGDDPRHPKYIETVRKVGYRLAQPATDWTQGRNGKVRLASALIAGCILIALVAAAWAYFRRADTRYELTPVATDLWDETRPAISPDGRQVAYEVEAGGGTTVIYVGSGVSGEASPVPGTAGSEAPVWLSNRSLAMQVRRGADCSLVAVDLGYRGARLIGRCDGSGYADLAVSPDGRRLAYNAFGPDRAGPRAIHVRELGGIDRRVTVPPAGSWGDYDPEFSPDGRSLLFTRATSEGQQDLFLLDGSGRERRLTRRFGNLFGATWADSGSIIYSARSGGRFGLRRLDLASGQDRPLPIAISDAVNPVMKNGALLVESRRFQIHLVSTGSGALPNSSGLNLHPALSPDGRKLVFMSDRSGSYELWLFDRPTGRLSQLTRYGGPFVGVPRFAPDGRSLVYEVRTGDDSDIHVIDLNSRRSKALLTGQYFDTAASVSADGRWVIFGSNRDGGWNLYRIPIGGGRRPQRIVEDAFAAIEAQDGSALYFTRRSRPGLFRQDRATGQTLAVDEKFAVEDWGAFAPVRDGVVFVDRQGPQRAQIAFVSKKNEKRVLVRPAAPLPAHDPVIASRSDLSEVIYVASDLGSGDIYRVTH